MYVVKNTTIFLIVRLL